MVFPGLAAIPALASLVPPSLGPGWTALAWVLDALSVALLVYWSIAAYRLFRTVRSIPTARAGVALASARPPMAGVCVVVPAHNEEETIGGLIESLRAQDYSKLSVVLCLDRCTDGTMAAAKRFIGGDARFSVLEIASCPEGWAGKVNAVWQGVQAPQARGADLLLFADADTSFDPACVRACAALLEARDIDLLSLMSTLTCATWFERIAQPAACFELVRQYPIGRANRRENPRAFANGQFMMFRREAYEAIGGHESVHDELLEDIALARRVAGSGRAAGLFLADGLLRCRMYDSWPAFREGWKRIYVEAAKRKPARLSRAAAAVLFTGFIFPAAAVSNLALSVFFLSGEPEGQRAGMIGLTLAGLGLAALLVVIGTASRMARAPLWTALCYPAGASLVAGILREAASDLRNRIPVRWAGREYVREGR